MHDDSANAIRNHLKRIIEEFGVKAVTETWKKVIEESKQQITQKTVSEWITKWTRLAKGSDKGIWE